MSSKIKGTVSPKDKGGDGKYILYVAKSFNLKGDLPATLVITEEEVYTKSEVEAMLREVAAQPGIWIADVQRVADKFGIKL